MNLYYVYILSYADNSYYTGFTNNLDRRLQEHVNGLDPKAYTFSRRPVAVVYREIFKEIEAAIAWEKQVKGWNRKKKEAIISGEWDILPELAACKNDTRRVLNKPEQ